MNVPHTTLAFLDDPALIFLFLCHYHWQESSRFKKSHLSDTEQRMCATWCKTSEIWAMTPLHLLGIPRHTFRCQLVHRDERWNPSFLSSQGRKVMKTLMEQSYWASCLGPKGGNVLNKAAASVPTSESGLGTEGREQKDETEDFRQYHDEGGCIWKISNFQLFCSSIWFILGSVTGVIFISFSAGKGSCVWSPHRD